MDYSQPNPLDSISLDDYQTPLDSIDLNDPFKESERKPTGTLDAYGQTITQAVKQVPGYIAASLEGSTPYDSNNLLDSVQATAKKDQEAFANGKDAQDPSFGGLATVQDIKQTAPSLAGSITGMVPTLAGAFTGARVGALAGSIGGIPGAVIGGTAGGIVGAGLGLFGMMRSAENQFVKENIDKENSNRAAQGQAPLTQQESVQLQNDLNATGDTRKMGMAEAFPETVGNLLETAVLATPIGKFGKSLSTLGHPLAKALTAGLMKGAATVATEAGEEEITRQLQNPIMQRHGFPEQTAGETLKQTAIATAPFAALGFGTGAYQSTKKPAEPVDTSNQQRTNINPDNNLDLRTDEQKAQDNASIIDSTAIDTTGLQGTPNPADAAPLTQPESLNGSQESTSETQNANAQEEGLLSTDALEQSGATSLVDNAPHDPLVSVIDRNTGTAFHVLQSDLDSNKDRLTKHSVTTGKRLLTPILRQDIVDEQTYQQELADQQQRQDEQANQQTETQAQDQTSADQSTAVTAPLLNKRTNQPFTTQKLAEAAIASSSNPTVNPHYHIAVPVDGGFGIVPKPNTLPGNNDTTTETQSVLSNTLANATGVTAPTSTDVAGQASTPAAQEVVPKTKLKQVGLAITRAAKTEHRSIDGVGGAYHRSTNDSRRSDAIHSLTQTTDANGNPDYTAHISINTPIDGASNGTKTNEGKYSLNALLNSGAISQQTHDFLVDEYHGKNNDVIEANNNHQLTAEEYVSNNNAQFPNSKGINDSLRKSHYTDIRSHLDQGGKISKEVFDSLDGLRRTNLIKNYGEDIIDAEAIKQPSKTQATEAAQEVVQHNKDSAPMLPDMGATSEQLDEYQRQYNEYYDPGKFSNGKNERSQVDLSNKADAFQALIDKKHEELDAQGISWDDQKKDTELHRLYSQRTRIDKEAMHNAYKGIRRVILGAVRNHTIDYRDSDLPPGLNSKVTEGRTEQDWIDYLIENEYHFLHNLGAYSAKELTDSLGQKKTIKGVAERIAKQTMAKDNPRVDYDMAMNSNMSGLSWQQKDKIKNEATKIAEEIDQGINDYLAGSSDNQSKANQKSITQETVAPAQETGNSSSNDQANKEPWEMTDREYGQHKDKEHEARRLENLAKVNADLDTLTNKSEGYDALMAKETAKVAHTITPEGKFSHNLRSGSRVYNSAHDFVHTQLYKRWKNTESHSGKFRSSFATDMSTQHAALQKAIDAGKTIPQNVLDSLPSNFPELKYPSVQESAKKPDWEMTRDEYKNSWDPRDYKDSNYDKMIHAAVFNEKITQAEADKKLIRDYSGNKYHWAKTRKELEQDKKEAVKNAKAARAESNKNPTHTVKWAQKSESNTAKNNITSTNLHHNKLLEVHQERVQEALSSAKPVPQEVLADYPDIKAPVQEIANPIHDATDVSKKDENVDTSTKGETTKAGTFISKNIDLIVKNIKFDMHSKYFKDNVIYDLTNTNKASISDGENFYQEGKRFKLRPDGKREEIGVNFQGFNNKLMAGIADGTLSYNALAKKQYDAEQVKIDKEAKDKEARNLQSAEENRLANAEYADTKTIIEDKFSNAKFTNTSITIIDKDGDGSNKIDDIVISGKEYHGLIVAKKAVPMNKGDQPWWVYASKISIEMGKPLTVLGSDTQGFATQKLAQVYAMRMADAMGGNVDSIAYKDINPALKHVEPSIGYSPMEYMRAVAYGGDPFAKVAIKKDSNLTTKGTVVADKAESNIQDFGEKLEGAKKFTYTFKEALSEDIDISAVPLSKSFPQPDYEKLIAGGINPQVAALIAQLRAEIPTKPSKSYRVSKWVAQVTAIREAADHLLSGDLTVEQFIQAGKDKDNYTKYMGDVLAIADSILPSQIRELGNFKLEHTLYGLHSGVKDVWKWSVINTASKSSWGKQFDTKEEAVAYIKSEISTENTKGESIAKFDRWTERGKPGVVFVGKKIASGKYITLKEFPTSKEALNYIIEHNAELVELLKQKKKDKAIRRAENNQRVGKDYRNGKNVSAKEFTDTFGFRGVQFGTWVENDRRQQDLNNAYDGLIDLAEVLGIPPKALALNGELGLAFGARGSGGENAAAAHYESNSVVINLTKKNGAGSLAHEWWHAVDNYFGKQESDGFLSDKGARRAQILDGNKYRESTDSDFAVRKEVFDAWQGVTKAIRTETQLVRRSVIKDKTRSKNYYATITEMTARSFERYVIGKLEDQGYSNDYLANIIPESTIDAQEKIEESDYPFPLQSEMAAVNKAYDKLFDTLETKETEKGTALFSKSTTPVVNPHSKTSLNQAVTKAMDTLFGQGWTNRLMATGKFKMISAAEATGIIGKNAMFHKVWHGSPHDHNKFDSEHIGNGEGAQAYGWGLYFSGSQQVAEWYRDKLSGNLLSAQSYSKDGKTISGMDVLKEYFKPGRIVNGYGGNDEVISFHEHDKNWGWSVVVKGVGETRQRSHSTDPEVINVNGVMDKEGWIGHVGKLYEVDLAPNQDEYLDWDKPFVMQSDKVKALLQAEMDKKYSPIGVANLPELGGRQPFGTGKALYKHIQSHFMSDEDASKYLHSLGIRGIRYKAEAGRSETTSNYVVFNDADIKIEAKYSKNGDVIAFYNPADDTTYLVHDNITQNTSDKALQGLMLHEIGVHALTLGKSNEVFKDILRRFEALKATNPKVQAAFNRVPKDTKAEDIVEEALAYYLSENPRSSLAQRIVEWFRQAVRALGKTLPVLERAKFSQWANKLTEAELIGMATSALKSAPDSLQFDNVGRNREGIKLSDKDNEAIKQYLEVEAKYFNADGSEKSGAMLAPNGERTNLTKLQWIQVRTDNFKRFYGDWEKDGIELRGMASNVEKSSHERGVYSGGTSTSRPRNSGPLVADNGEPVIFYHGTKDIIEKGFDLDHPNKKDKGWLGRGVYAYDSYGASFMHAGNKEGARSLVNVISLFMAVKHPYIADDSVKNKLKNSNQEGIQEFTQDLIDKGYDGAIMLHKELGNVIEIVSFSTNAVKSATENNGDFSQSNNSIKFSRSTLSNTPADNSAMRSFFAPAKGKQALGWLAGVFQRNHLIDFVAQDLPELVNYKLLSQAKDNFTNQRENKIGESYQEMMDKMDAKTMHELGRVQGMATRLVTFDPATIKSDGTPEQYLAYISMSPEQEAVYDAYSAMPEGAKEVYVKMRKAYQDDLTEKKNALIERIKAFPADKETQAEIISTIQKHFDQFKEGVYFPLNRDGAVIVKATNQDGELVIEHVATQAAAYKLVQEMTAQGYDNTHIIGKDAYDRDLLAGNAANEMATLAHKTISDLKEKSIQGKLTESDFNDLFSEFNQLLINTLPDSSYRKHFIHRKGTLGESTDTLRAYAKTRTSAVKMIASLTYDHQIQDVLNNADKAIKEMDKVAGSDTLAIKSIVNELKLRESALKSTEINAVSQVLTSLGFMGALGFNIGSAAVNMLQVVGVALPELVGKHGYVEATKEISAAYKLLFNPANLDKASGLDITKNPQLTAIAKQAMEYLASIGKIDLTMTHDSIAAGKNPSYSSNPLTRAFGGAAKYSGYFFHVAEAANRQVTGMAAFNLAYQKNGGDFKAAIADAVDVIDRTQFDYGQGNRARYMMSNTARVLTLFKAYALGMSYFIGRNAYQYMKGETPEVRLQARKTLIASMAMSFATAGLFGMPIGLEAFAAIGGVAAFKYKGAKFAVPGAIGGMLIFQALLAGLGADDEDELETEFRNWLTDNFDQTIAEWVTKGPARLLPIGDIASRTSLSELWWRSQNKQLEGTDQYNAIATALIGPIGSQVAGLFTAKKMYEDGQYKRMMESMSPAFLRNAIAADRMGSEGVTNLKGDKIIQRDLTPVELINKVIGFNPTVVTNTYDANSAIAKESTKHTLAKSHLVNRWMSGDATERSDLMKGAIKDFNESVPPSERITLKSLFKSMRSRKGIDKHTQNGLYLSKKQNYLRDLGRFNRQE